MIEAARARGGKLKRGGTIVEPTSGNTGVRARRSAPAIKGYRCIFVMPDKMSQEKIALLRALRRRGRDHPDSGSRHDSPESYYSVSDRLARGGSPGGLQARPVLETLANPEAHYRLTGPEIWEAGPAARIERDRRLGRNGRHDQRRRPLLQGAKAGGC